MQKQSSSESPFLDPPGIPSDPTARSQRRRIVDAMVTCSAEKTYTGTTIADIVARAGVSRTTFYKFFADKRACFDAALDSCIEQVGEVAGAAVSGSDSPPQAVHKASVAVLDRLAAKPAIAQVLVTEAVSVDPTVLARYRALLMPPLEAMLGPGRGAISPGLAIGRAQLLILNQLAGDGARRLSDLEPEIVYLALAPFLGHQEALAQARPVAGRDYDSQS
jgi:AcrR family transcriptional regulator